MSKIKVKFEEPSFCSYDNVWKISWTINGRRTNSFSSRGKRIGQTISPKQIANEYREALKRGQIVVDFLTQKITRKQAINNLKDLRFLCPKNQTSHLLTLAEFALNLR